MDGLTQDAKTNFANFLMEDLPPGHPPTPTAHYLNLHHPHLRGKKEIKIREKCTSDVEGIQKRTRKKETATRFFFRGWQQQQNSTKGPSSSSLLHLVLQSSTICVDREWTFISIFCLSWFFGSSSFVRVLDGSLTQTGGEEVGGLSSVTSLLFLVSRCRRKLGQAGWLLSRWFGC